MKFIKQTEIPIIKKKNPTYMGFRVFEKMPSVIMLDDVFISNVVSCFLNNSLAFPIITKPPNEITIPIKLYGNRMIL